MKKFALIAIVAILGVGLGVYACGGMSPAPAAPSTSTMVDLPPDSGTDVTNTTGDLSGTTVDFSNAACDGKGKASDGNIKAEDITQKNGDLSNLSSDLPQSSQQRGDGSYADTVL